jgi:hypothetical protein
LFLFCVWDFLSYRNDISLCTKHAPFLMLYFCTVNTEPDCLCNIVRSVTDKLELHFTKTHVAVLLRAVSCATGRMSCGLETIKYLFFSFIFVVIKSDTF